MQYYNPVNYCKFIGKVINNLSCPIYTTEDFNSIPAIQNKMYCEIKTINDDNQIIELSFSDDVLKRAKRVIKPNKVCNFITYYNSKEKTFDVKQFKVLYKYNLYYKNENKQQIFVDKYSNEL